MSRDYKSKNPPVNKGRGGGLLIGIFVGLLLGLGIAVGVAWYMNHAQIPFITKVKPADKPGPAIAEPGTAAAGINSAGTGVPPPVPPMAGQTAPQAAGQSSGQSTGQSGQTTGQAPDKTHFDFYKILPGTEEAVTEQQIKQAERSPSTVEAGKVKFYLQAGSFPSGGDADNLKARLALIGVEATVQTADLGDKGVWNRVMIGPYAKIEDTSKLRQLLSQNGIEATMIKVKDTGR
jgi:cell division protein FtsN